MYKLIDGKVIPKLEHDYSTFKDYTFLFRCYIKCIIFNTVFYVRCYIVQRKSQCFEKYEWDGSKAGDSGHILLRIGLCFQYGRKSGRSVYDDQAL